MPPYDIFFLIETIVLFMCYQIQLCVTKFKSYEFGHPEHGALRVNAFFSESFGE